MIDIKIIKLNKYKNICTLKNKTTKLSLWFIYPNTYNPINKIKKGINLINLGSIKSLVLKGVGFKGEIINNKLNLRVGKGSEIYYTIPSTIVCWINNNTIECWSLDEQKLNNFLNKIITKTPVKKGTLIIE